MRNITKYADAPKRARTPLVEVPETPAHIDYRQARLATNKAYKARNRQAIELAEYQEQIYFEIYMKESVK
jgi:hypothetical protein